MKILLFVFSLTFGFVMYAQVEEKIEKKSTSELGIKTGAVIPVGVFASDDITDTEAGAANMGFGFEVYYRADLNDAIAALFLFNYQSNPVNEDILENLFFGLPPNTFFSLSTKNWKQTRFMLGLGAGIPVGTNGNVLIDNRFLLGLNNATNPSITVTLANNGIEQITRTFEKTVSGFTFTIGTGVKFGISNGIDFMYHIDYSSSNIEFSNVLTERRDNGVPVFRSTDDFDQPISTLTMSLGLAFKL